jgi:hypothetical protein
MMFGVNAGGSKTRPSYPPNPDAPRRALSLARPQRVKQAEVEVKVERSRILPSPPRPEPQPFRQPADCFNILLGACPSNPS